MKKKTLLLCALAAAIVAFFVLGGDRLLTFDTLIAHREALIAAVETRQIQSMTAYFVLYLTFAAASLPGSAILTLCGGMLFGLAGGAVLSSFASTIGATLAFLFSRTLLREPMERRLGGWLRRFNAGIAREGALYLLSLRLIPVIPFPLINLVAGLTNLRLGTFVWASQLGMLPATILYAHAGTMLGDISSPGDVLTWPVLTAFAALAMLPWAARFLFRFIRRRHIYRSYVKPERFEHDLVVIGAGAAGLVAANVAATLRASVTLIEQNRMGGDCLNTGCVPSKALIRAARLAYDIRQARRLGIDVPAPTVSLPDVMRHIRDVIAAIEPHDSAERYAALGVTIRHGAARVIDPWHVEITAVDGSACRISTRAIIIATGAEPAIPSVPGLRDTPYLTSETLWDHLSRLTVLPPRIAILGGGPIGCELAQAFARLGSGVTVLEQAKQLLPHEDEDVAAFARIMLESEGVAVLTGARLRHCSAKGAETILTLDGEHEQRLSADMLIVATGRTARLSGFGLEELGIAAGQKIEINEFLETRFPNILAAGDVASPFRFTHAAGEQGWRAAINALLGGLWRLGVDFDAMPAVTFTDPEIARVGFSESSARHAGLAFETTTIPFSDLDRALVDRAATGFIKILTEPGKDRILGATIVGAHAGEIVSVFALSIRKRLGLGAILATIHAYPTFAEIGKLAAREWRRKQMSTTLLRLLERFHTWRRGS